MYLNVIQLAESLGVEESVVEDWVRKDGLPCVQDGSRLFFDRAQVTEWAAARGLAAKAGFLAPARAMTGSSHRLEQLLRVGGIWRDVAPAEVLLKFEHLIGLLPGTTPAVRQLLAQRVRTPGAITWAPVESGVALPHLRAHVALGREAGLLALLFLKEALPLPEPPNDGVPVTRLFFFIAPSPRAHLEMLSQLCTALSRGELRQRVRERAPDAQLFAALSSAPNPKPAEAAK